MDFGQVRQIILRQAENYWDERFPPSVMTFNSFDSVRIGDNTYGVSPSAKRLIGQRLGIPAPYLDRCPSELQERNLNYWLRELDQHTQLFCRFDNQVLRALFTKRYAPMDNHDIIQQLDIPEHTRCVFRVDDGMMQLSIPDRASMFSVAPNDELMPGVALSNSEVGLKTFSISAYYLRIVCTNGMISTEQVNQSFRHTSTKGLDNFYDVMQTVSRQVLMNSERFKLAVDSPVENPQALIENFGKQFQLTKNDISEVLSYYANPDTMWSVINAFTAAANSTSISVEKSFAFQRIGGRILALTKKK